MHHSKDVLFEIMSDEFDQIGKTFEIRYFFTSFKAQTAQQVFCSRV